jgi:murein tripeptide amidase MpaA
MLNGALEIITDPNNEQGKILRNHFVFKVVPIINPDGVARGFYRLDTMAYNLNRFYLAPNRVSYTGIP